ncbi:MAG TPA: hypothetical protein PKN65_10885, partial [Tenuifilaceae bacterium]|nr:hypothetical protein [Tenuifilaceae bacterium]
QRLFPVELHLRDSRYALKEGFYCILEIEWAGNSPTFIDMMQVFVLSPGHCTGPSSIWEPVFGFSARRRA